MLEIKDFYDFSVSTWYPQFIDITLKTVIIHIPSEIIGRIQTEGFDLINKLSEDSLKEFVSNLQNGLHLLDNCVFIKNNWHAPVDAKMFTLDCTLKVTNVKDLLTCFIASDRILNDFNHESIPHCLALRPWKSIHPASEFRCIVINKVLRGITPRDWPTFYTHFKEDGPQIIHILKNFFDENIKMVFEKNNYIFDAVIPYPSQTPYLLDFGPLNSKTNLYAFSWKEMSPLILQPSTCEEIAPVFRFLETDIGIMTKTNAMQMFSEAQS